MRYAPKGREAMEQSLFPEIHPTIQAKPHLKRSQESTTERQTQREAPGSIFINRCVGRDSGFFSPLFAKPFSLGGGGLGRKCGKSSRHKNTSNLTERDGESTYLLKPWCFWRTGLWKGKNDLVVRQEYSNVASKAQQEPKELGPPTLLLSSQGPSALFKATSHYLSSTRLRQS